jgi:hypothetical protein
MKKRLVLVMRAPRQTSWFLVGPANQGRYHYDLVHEALEAAETLRPGLKEKLGIQEVKVVEADCYDSGDCCKTVFEPEYVLQNEVQV